MIKVAGYCRVSTDKEDQINSFETQQKYFREYIRNHPEWQLYEIYADEGITGTNTKKRGSFNRMINDAFEGKFDLIVTKEVSRFSRNILDTIRYTRELREIGVGVIFLNDRINTLEPESEMLLSFLASLAQEESRRTSSRVIWGQTRQMEKGIVFGHGLLGYDVYNGVLKINEDGAEVVRLIFQKYAMEQVGTSEIARFLTKNGYSTYAGNKQWKANTIIKILKNEKYIGNLIQKKTYTHDFLTHEKRTNKGEQPLITLKNHHDPIVSREIWDLAQKRLRKNNKRGNGSESNSNRYTFSGKIKCGECGSSFVGRFRYLNDGTKIRRWRCGTASNSGVAACGVGRLLRDEDALQMFKTSIQSLSMDINKIINHVTDLVLDSVQNERDPAEEMRQLQVSIDRLLQRKEKLIDSFCSGEITKTEMLSVKRKYEMEIDNVHQKMESLEQLQEKNKSQNLRPVIQSQVSGILRGDIESEVFCKNMLNSMTVFKDRHVELRLNFLPHVFCFRE